MHTQVPKDREELFAYPVDWVVIERCNIIKSKMRPWITKKIKEYLGEEEQTLINFITNKLGQHAGPLEFLSELKLVLEDEADVFVQKMWRILIFYALQNA